MERPSSNLFEGYRSVGHVTGPLPFIVRHGKSPQDTRIVTIVGKTFYTYTTNLSLVEVSIPHEENISAVISDERFIYSASGRTIFQWTRGSRALFQRLDNGHQSNVTSMTKVGHTRLLSVDEDNVLCNWDLKDLSILNIIPIDAGSFKISTLCHPMQYKHKCLLGSEQGALQLWNIVTEECLYKFAGWESPVTCLQQSPVEHVVGIGLADGHVYIQNIRYDETVLKIYQEYGPITSMSFRLDNQPYLVTASDVGHLMVWNLERKRLSTQLRNSHSGPISKCQFVRNESLLVTSGLDNALKIWTMDMSDGGGRLHCQRAGHSEPPSHIRFYGAKGFNLLSAGNDSTIKMFHLYSERLNRNLGTARLNPKRKNKHSINKLPPITCFAAESAKEKQWDNIVACHKNSSLVTTWSYDKCRMGEHIIAQPTFNKHEVFASSVCLTSCGHFTIIGFSNGLIFKYNIQSGQFRQYYECPQLTDNRAHDGGITGITVDSLDRVLVSSGEDCKLRLWNFKTAAMLSERQFSSPIKRLELHRENNLIAIGLEENGDIEVMDLETREIVRKFSLPQARLLDMTFSPDSRWLIVSYDDKSIRTWDLSLDKMIDAFKLSSCCISLSISSTGEFLATAHDNSLGINVWSNYTIYCPTPLRPIDAEREPPLLDMPFVRCDELSDDEDESGDRAEENPDGSQLVEPTYASPEQLHEDLITLSGLPQSRWKNLLNIEEIRQRQLIEDEKKREKPIKVPFFIPVKDGLKPTLDQEALDEYNEQLRQQQDGTTDVGNQQTTKISELRLLSPLTQCLVKCGQQEPRNFDKFFSQLKELGPSATDAEIRSLGKDTCGDIQPMLCFLDAIESFMKQNVDYELASSWLALFLKAHSDIIQTDGAVRKRCADLLNPVKFKWDRLSEEFNQIFCVLNFIRSSIL